MTIKKTLLLLLISTLLTMVVGLYNGFPMTESDTGAYISHGFHLQLPEDRTPFYGIFLGISSLWTSLWLTIFVQGLILSFVLLRYMDLLRQRPINFRLGLICMLTIVAFTCVSWVSGYLMPDVFAGILLLTVILFLFGTKKWDLFIYSLIILGAILIHNSHFLIVAIFSFLLIIYAFIQKHKRILYRSIAMLAMSIFCWASMCSINYVKHHGFTFSRASHVFMVTKFAETGILNTYLDDNCGKKQLKLCPYKDQIPAYSWDFLWLPESPLYKTGGWDSNKHEFDMIIHDVLTTPKYLRMYLTASAVSTLRQLTQIQATDKASFQGKGSQPYNLIQIYYPDELREYSVSHQNTDGLSGSSSNIIYDLFFILSSLWVLFYYPTISKNKHLLFIYGCVLTFIIINAFVTSTFSTVIYRLQDRVFWILPATNACIIIYHYFEKFNSKYQISE